MSSTKTSIDDYLANVPPEQRKALERVRTIAKKLIPQAEETISYGVPTLKYKGTYVIYFAAFKNHMSIFPGPRTMTVKDKLKDYKLGKGTIQFTLDKPVPAEVIEALVHDRLAQINLSKDQ